MQNTALIGLGRWGKNLARNFYQLGALRAICDADAAALQSCLDLYPGVTAVTDVQDILNDPAIERVAIAAPSFKHYEIAKHALLLDKDVYVEKPLCLDLSEAEELVFLAESRRRILMVGHLLQYHPCVEKLRELVLAGECGEIQYIVSNRLNLGALRLEENALWDLSPHDISVVLSLCNHRLPSKVRCEGKGFVTEHVADAAVTTLQFSPGPSVHIYANRLNPFKEHKLTVVGKEGMAVFDDTLQWEDKLQIFRKPLRWPSGAALPVINPQLVEKIAIPQSEPLRAECAHFIQCCDARTTPRTDGQEALRVMRVLSAAQRSLDAQGESVELEERPLVGSSGARSLNLPR